MLGVTVPPQIFFKHYLTVFNEFCLEMSKQVYTVDANGIRYHLTRSAQCNKDMILLKCKFSTQYVKWEIFY